MEIAVMLLKMLADRERIGLPVRVGQCTCGNSVRGLSCDATCKSVAATCESVSAGVVKHTLTTALCPPSRLK